MIQITDTTVGKLLKKQDKTWEKFKKLRDAIEALRAICKHDWKPNGYDSHKNHYVCVKCGEEDAW